MNRVFIIYEHHDTDKYIIGASFDFDKIVKQLIHQKANGPKELIELTFNRADGSGPEEITIAVEGGALHKAASFREKEPETPEEYFLYKLGKKAT